MQPILKLPYRYCLILITFDFFDILIIDIDSVWRLRKIRIKYTGDYVRYKEKWVACEWCILSLRIESRYNLASWNWYVILQLWNLINCMTFDKKFSAWTSYIRNICTDTLFLFSTFSIFCCNLKSTLNINVLLEN